MFRKRFHDLAAAVQHTHYTQGARELTEEEAFETVWQLFAQVLSRKGIVYVIGNGGSAGIASHFSVDLIKTLKIPSQTLFDSNLMTCLSNDWGYDQVFSYPLKQLLHPEDLLVAISSSGKSPNIVQAAQIANSLEVPVFALSGFLSNNPLRTLGTLSFWVDRCDYGLVETTHFFLLHTLIDLRHQYTPIKPQCDIHAVYST